LVYECSFSVIVGDCFCSEGQLLGLRNCKCMFSLMIFVVKEWISVPSVGRRKDNATSVTCRLYCSLKDWHCMAWFENDGVLLMILVYSCSFSVIFGDCFCCLPAVLHIRGRPIEHHCTESSGWWILPRPTESSSSKFTGAN